MELADICIQYFGGRGQHTLYSRKGENDLNIYIG